MEKLSGKVAVVTGAASGIGFALASAFVDQGMRVAIADVEADALKAAAERLGSAGGDVHAVVCDVSEAAQVENLREETLAAFGAAHVICNNAGVGAGGPSWEIPLAKWRWVMGVNFWGVVHGVAAFVPLLLEQGEGHVVNTASAAGLTAVPYMGPYTASKHAVVALTEALAMELAIAGSAVGTSVLCPLWVKTRIHESERNAPAEVVAAGETPEGALGSGLVAGLVAGGMEPGDVAAEVVSAIREDRFYVLPHEEVKAAVSARAERVARGETPTLQFPL